MKEYTLKGKTESGRDVTLKFREDSEESMWKSFCQNCSDSDIMGDIQIVKVTEWRQP